MNDDIPWAGDLKDGGNSGIVPSRQRYDFDDHTVLVRFGEEEHFVAPCFPNGVAQKPCGWRRNEFVKIRWHYVGTLGEYITRIGVSWSLSLAFRFGADPPTLRSWLALDFVPLAKGMEALRKLTRAFCSRRSS